MEPTSEELREGSTRNNIIYYQIQFLQYRKL